MKYMNQLKADPVTRQRASQKYNNTSVSVFFTSQNAKHRCILRYTLINHPIRLKKSPIVNSGLETHL